MPERSEFTEGRRLISELRARPRPHIFQALDRLSPYWGPQLVVLVVILLGLILPDEVRIPIGPRWLLPAIEGLLLIGVAGVSPHPKVRHHPRRRQFAMALIGLVSLVNIISLVRLSDRLINYGHTSARILIVSGAILWLNNVLLFGLWYWELDRGGPADREAELDRAPDFMFPQMTDPSWAPPEWRPGLVDYLYVSFTNATAFSPTDTMPLTSIAKSLMSAQALTSLVTVGLVVARAVNILNS
jgi:uncharacterized membrane protein